MYDSIQKLLWRLLASTAVGVAMAGMTYLCAFGSMRDASPYRERHWSAFQILGRLREALEQFHEESRSYPEKLADLKANRDLLVEFEPSGHVLDPWGHPYDYSSQGSSYTLRSLGSDGKPGGMGLAADADAREIVPENGMYRFPGVGSPTLWQFTFDCDTGSMKGVCVSTGILAFVICLVTLRNERVRPAVLLGRLVTTLVVCLMVTMFISVLHIPSHH
jgi:hypothetical protein